MSTNPPGAVGKSLFESRTVWSILAAAFFAYLPSLLTSVGVPAAQQGAVLDALHQIGTPLALVAGILFHAISTKPVTSILPAKTPPVPPAAVALLAVFLLFGTTFLQGCKSVPLAPPNTELGIVEGDTILDRSLNVAIKLYLADLPNLTPAQHDTAKATLQKAAKLVLACDTGTLVTGEASLDAQIADAASLIAQVKALIPAAPAATH